MRVIYIVLAFALVACTETADNDKSNKTMGSEMDSSGVVKNENEEYKNDPSTSTTYSNEHIKAVKVEKVTPHRFKVRGIAQVFEANINWVVEDGHNELKSGFETTSAGAPNWGKFEFVVYVEKQRPNSTLTLVLFETSMKDGSRLHELAIPLPDEE